MSGLGFDSAWIELIMLCVSTVSYSVLVKWKGRWASYSWKGIKAG